MFSSGPKYQRLIANLRLAINRLKLLEKKKTELAIKARREISEYLANGKEDRARIRVEHIVREDYLVEAMELIEMYCDLLLARMGLIQSSKELDPGLEEPIATIIWATPRLQAEVQELRVITEQLTAKYGKEFAESCTRNTLGNVNEKVVAKLGVQAPPRSLVEKYMEEIAKTYNVPFVPDPDVIAVDEILQAEGMLIDLDNNKRGGSGGGGSGGGGGMRSPQQMPSPHSAYPQQAPSAPGIPQEPYHPGYPGQMPQGGPPPPAGYNMPAAPNTAQMYNYPQAPAAPAPQSPMKQEFNEDSLPDLPDLPSVPNSSVAPSAKAPGSDSVDFDDLTRRFEELKKRK